MDSKDHSAWNAADLEAITDLLGRRVQQPAIVFLDNDGNITGWSTGAYCLTGFSAEEVLGRSAALLFTPEDRARQLDVHERHTALQIGEAEDERWHLRKDGSRFWSSGITFPVQRDGTVQGFVKLFRDATHLRARMKSLENEAQQSAKERAERAVYLATLAHELRNPLQPMKTATWLLARQGGLSAETGALKILRRQITFMERLVEDLVDMTRLAEGKMHLTYREVILQDLVQEVVEASREVADAKGLTLSAVVSPVPIPVEVDPERVHQVLVNLVNNAIKFTPAGGAIWVRMNADQTHFLVHVRDTGKGIKAELQPKVFEMFTQADAAATHRGAGLGIGLALVKEIVSLHQGTVEVRSEGEGKGSEFTVRIPLRRPQGSESEPQGEAQDRP